MELFIVGGCGEYGRSCFLVQGGVVFVSDSQLRNLPARRLARSIADSGGLVLLTGTSEPGSFARELLHRGDAYSIRYPVHLDWGQYSELVQQNSFENAIPFHTEAFSAPPVIPF